MRTFLRHSVHTVFVMLGPRCNLSCRYCLQHGVRDTRETGQVSETLLEFLLDLATNQEEELAVHFYGGEPLLYRDAIDTITEALRGEPNIVFSMISNGTLIDRQTAEWCNELGMRVAVSWDGPRTSEARGADVFADPETRAAILGLNHLGISAVVSACAYPLEILDAYAALDREYYDRHGRNTMLNFDELMDTGLADRSLFAIDLGRVRDDMETIAAAYEQCLRGGEHDPWQAAVGRNYVNRLRGTVLHADTLERGTCACGNGISTLNVDLAGNLYRCHNTDTIIGTVNDGFAPYCNRLMLLDPTRENSRVCAECPVVSLCANGCPLIGRKEREETYCPLKRAMFQPIVDLVFRLGGQGSSPVESPSVVDCPGDATK